jgi:hypothetical protein
MTIWILAILFLASLAGLGYRQGAVRVGFSLIGILLGAVLAVPLGNLLKPVISAVGVKNPALLWLLPPCIIFLLILSLVKIGGLMVHKKIEVYYKYKAGDLRLSLWERLNQRVGLCLGALNATAYIILISLLVYMVSYWTYQASTDSDPKSIRFVNRMGKDLERTGMSKVVGAVDHTSKAFYDTADIAGLLYQTPLLEARLSRYPGILGLAEKPEFQDLATDTQFAELRQRRAPISEVLNYPKIQAMLNNADLLKTIKSAIVPNLQDLRTFLETGESAKFTEKFLGRWNFDLAGTMGLFRKDKPNLTAKQLAQQRGFMSALFGKAVFVATPEQQAFLKNVPSLKPAPGAGSNLQTLQGEWKGADGNYDLTITSDGKAEQMKADLQGSRLNVTAPGIGLVFSRED